MKDLMILLTSAALLMAPMAHAKGKEPCSGKKGGVASCTKDGKFMCNNGTLSKSKRKCTK